MPARKLLKAYRLDLVVLALACATAAGLGAGLHGLLKPYSAQVAMAAPLIFTISVLLFLTVICTRPHDRWAKVSMRLLVDAALLGLAVPMAFLKVESLLAPWQWAQKTPPAQVIRWIASDQDPERLAAWARLTTMPRADKELVAKGLAPLLIGTDAAARRSAELTLNVPLRQFSLAALTVLTGDLKTYLAKRADTTEAPEAARRAGAFAAEFVGNNVGSIHKALDKEKRAQLPEGGLEALFLALAAEPTIGPIYLHELVRHGDQTERPLAESVLHLAAIRIPTT